MAEVIEQTLLLIREGHVYKIPPRQTSAGYRCADWDPHSKGPLAVVRVRVIAKGDRVEIKLEDTKTNNLFASCIVDDDMSAIEQVIDSSRYFALRIDDGKGHHAFIGLGFKERSTAFDLNVALQDHFRWVKGKNASGVEEEEEVGGHVLPPVPETSELALKEGETIKIAVKGSRRRKKPPAPSTGGISVLPPPTTTSKPTEDLADVFSGISVTKPVEKPKDGSWVTF